MYSGTSFTMTACPYLEIEGTINPVKLKVCCWLVS